MSGLDLLVLIILSLSVGIGIWRGLIKEVFSFITWGGAITAALFYSAPIAQTLKPYFLSHMALSLIAMVLTFIATFIVLGLIGHLISRFFAKIGLGFLDRFLGLCFGALRAFIIIMVLVLLAGLTSLPAEPWWREAKVARPLEMMALSLAPYLPDAISKRISYRAPITTFYSPSLCAA